MMKIMKVALFAVMVLAGGISNAQANCKHLCGFSNGVVYICDGGGRVCRLIYLDKA